MGLSALPVEAAKTRPYSISLEVVYGRQTSRHAYLEEIERQLATWVAATGGLDAPTERLVTDLHLRVIIDKIERSRGYANVSGERNVFADTGTLATSPYLYRTRLEVRAAVIDLQREESVLFEDAFTIYTEVQETKVAPNPRQRSWDDNLEFLVKRLHGLGDRS